MPSKQIALANRQVGGCRDKLIDGDRRMQLEPMATVLV
jgi:hypothetical protein